ncbi:MAG: hypothetical protein A2284_18930 [Deltaproteobacteria bacterium RIFOXYA12_FULL_61_11]|nr:MAG: hypothetical protein A2284_18930 [Deltaproteobacteria bacterium RIFOXYA12_FULL_61_11]
MKLLSVLVLLLPIAVLALFDAPAERYLGASVPLERFRVDYPPDPINVRNLNFYLPQEDLALPCYGFDLQIQRSYNSMNQFDGPFGIGWTFNHNLRIYENGKTLVLNEGDGFISTYEFDAYHDIHKAKVIELLLDARKAEDKRVFNKLKPSHEYEALRQRLESDKEFYASLKNKYLLAGGKPQPGTYISTTRGKSWIRKGNDGTYVRTMLSGRTEYYNKTGQVTKITDRSDNTLSYSYIKGSLESLTDPCGRKVRFQWNKYGKIASIVDPFNQTYRYTYDPKGRLESATTPKGKTQYFYSKKNTMLRVIFPDKSETTLRYNNEYRVVEHVVPNQKTTYQYQVDPSNKFHHITKAITSDGKVTTYEYFHDEYKSITTEPSGSKEVVVVSACCGKPLSRTDERGQGEFFTYDDNDNLTKREYSSGRVIYYNYEQKFNQINTMRYNDGTTIDFRYDSTGNLIQVKESTGEILDIVYNRRGKITDMTKGKDLRMTFKYNTYGKPVEIIQAGTGSLVITYDRYGETTNVEGKPLPGSKVSAEEVQQKVKMTLSYLLQMLQPTGISLY